MTRPRELISSALSPRARPARVSALLVGVVAMSMADLYMTLTHLVHFGMIEVNPLARRVMEHGSAAELIMWKLVTVLIAVVLLFAARKRRSAELGAIICCGILVWLTAHWINYNQLVSLLTTEMHALSVFDEDGRWVSFVGQE